MKGTSHSLLSEKSECILYQDFRYNYIMFAKFAFIREIFLYTQETQQLLSYIAVIYVCESLRFYVCTHKCTEKLKIKWWKASSFCRESETVTQTREPSCSYPRAVRALLRTRVSYTCNCIKFLKPRDYNGSSGGATGPVGTVLTGPLFDAMKFSDLVLNHCIPFL